jgi:hypothetical protein
MKLPLDERLRTRQNIAVDEVDQVKPDEQHKRPKSGIEAGTKR